MGGWLWKVRWIKVSTFSDFRQAVEPSHNPVARRHGDKPTTEFTGHGHMRSAVAEIRFAFSRSSFESRRAYAIINSLYSPFEGKFRPRPLRQRSSFAFCVD